MIDYTVDGVLKNMNVIVSRPDTPLQYDPSEMIEMVDRVLKSKITSLIMSVREEYFVTFKDFTVASGDSTGFLIPSDAIGMKLRQVATVSTVQDTNPRNIVTLPRLLLEQVNGTFQNQFIPQGYYIQNNSVILFPAPTGNVIIRAYYLKRPLKLTSTEFCAQIQSINTGSNTFTTVAVAPANFTDQTQFSTIKPLPGFGSADLTVQSFSGQVFQVADVTGLEVGDWIALQGYSPIPQIPVELFELLTQGACVEYQKGLTDEQAYQDLKADYMALEKEALTVITQRVEGVNKKVTTNGNGLADFVGVGGRFMGW